MANGNGNGGQKFVTNSELDSKLDKLLEKVPTRWEVRFLILAAVVATQIIPAKDVASAAIGFLQ